MMGMHLRSGKKEPECLLICRKTTQKLPDNVEDENADEHGYVSELEKGTA